MFAGVTFENAQGGLLFSGTGSRLISVGMLVLCKTVADINFHLLNTEK